MDRLKAIEYFIKTVELGGFTAAAKSMGVPASSVSRRVQDLEHALGTSLLHRTTRTVKLTELGALYLEQVRPALDALSHADEVIQDRPTSPTGQLRITAAPTFGTVALLPAISKLRCAYPNLIVDLELTDHAYNLASNEVDIAIRATADLPERVIARKLVENDHQLVASPEYLAQRGTPRVLSDLKQHQAVFYRIPGRIVDWHAHTETGWRDVDIHRGFVSNISEALLSEVVAGRGFALFPKWGIKAELEAGKLVPVTLNDARLSLSRSHTSGVYLLYNQPKYRLNKIKTTVDFLVQELAQ
ncbi:MAG: LysR substrate-binding domain-containing protein [Pseudomonadota bacterium]